ncbi:MAG TPA: hypothetical protein VFS43_27510 [Polyangiaceae bacterium]|nr:hypothetical protein [Polyangiaceae bacterium]
MMNHKLRFRPFGGAPVRPGSTLGGRSHEAVAERPKSSQRSRRSSLHAAAICAAAALAGCQGEPEDAVEDAEEEEVGAAEQSLDLCLPPLNTPGEARRLFEKETFGGNGRTCLTCHKKGTGTLSPEDVQARFAADPDDPLFSHDGSDDFQGHGVTRILEDATILVRIPLPSNVKLANDPTATSIVLRRGIPTTLNTPALDPVLMYDGRAPNLSEQARDAIHSHYQNTIEPTNNQLKLIAQHQKTPTFFSSAALRFFANGGPPPKLPKGWTPAEKRGRQWLEDAPVPPAINSQTSRKGLCALCHSGPMLNQTNGFGFFPLPPFPTAPEATKCDQPATAGTPVPAGRRFDTALISELNIGNEPKFSFLVKMPNGSTVALPPIADPGRALITGNFQSFPSLNGDLFHFKIPTLWGIKKTAPYFHNNSSKTLEEMIEHYAVFFQRITDCNIDGDPPLVMTAGDKADLLAYLRLL